MSRLVKQIIPTGIAMITGLVVLIGYLVLNPVLAYYRDRVIEWAVIVAAFAFALGVLNIARVHCGQVLQRRQGWLYSLVLLFAMAIGLIPPVLRALPSNAQVQTLDHLVFDYVISPLGASLAALVAFTLAVAAFRMLRVRHSWGAAFFMLLVGVVLLTSTPLVGLEWLPFAYIRHMIVEVLGMAGMRGLLLGVVLGTVITAVRVLVGSDRPHSEL